MRTTTRRAGEPRPAPPWPLAGNTPNTARLAAYVAAGGQTVVYVGERESQLVLTRDARAECGASSSRAFQRMLAQYYELADEVPIPRWPFNADDLTVWRRRELGREAEG